MSARVRPRGGPSTFLMFCDLLFSLVAVLVLVLFTFLIEKRAADAEAASATEGAAESQAEVDELREQLVRSGVENDLSEIARTEAQEAKTAAERDAEAARSEAAASRDEAERQKTQNDALEREIDGLRRNDIDLCVCVDGSASMAASIDGLKAAVVSVAELFPRASSLHVGVIVYREAPAETFPLSPLLTPDEDAGASLKALQAFFDAQEAEAASVDVGAALRAGRTMLNGGRAEARKVLMLLGDAGPEEASTPKAAILTAAENWTQRGDDRRLFALYAGGTAESEIRQFFQDVGGVSRDSVFSDRPADILAFLFEAAFTTPEKE